MLRTLSVVALFAFSSLVGCGQSVNGPGGSINNPAVSGDPSTVNENSSPEDETPPPVETSTPDAPADTPEDSDAATPAAGTGSSEARTIELTPGNTVIEFIGNHTGDDPKPRLGRFDKLSGTVVWDGSLKSVTVEVSTPSIATEFDKLTTHLKNADFFDVEKFPLAKFESTEIKDSRDGEYSITGNLTMLGNTEELTFSAAVGMEQGFTLESQFQLDRTKWGMNYGSNDIEAMVEMNVTVSE